LYLGSFINNIKGTYIDQTGEEHLRVLCRLVVAVASAEAALKAFWSLEVMVPVPEPPAEL